MCILKASEENDKCEMQVGKLMIWRRPDSGGVFSQRFVYIDDDVDVSVEEYELWFTLYQM